MAASPGLPPRPPSPQASPVMTTPETRPRRGVSFAFGALDAGIVRADSMSDIQSPLRSPHSQSSAQGSAHGSAQADGPMRRTASGKNVRAPAALRRASSVRLPFEALQSIDSIPALLEHEEARRGRLVHAEFFDRGVVRMRKLQLRYRVPMLAQALRRKQQLFVETVNPWSRAFIAAEHDADLGVLQGLHDEMAARRAIEQRFLPGLVAIAGFMGHVTEPYLLAAEASLLGTYAAGVAALSRSYEADLEELLPAMHTLQVKESRRRGAVLDEAHAEWRELVEAMPRPVRLRITGTVSGLLGQPAWSSWLSGAPLLDTPAEAAPPPAPEPPASSVPSAEYRAEVESLLSDRPAPRVTSSVGTDPIVPDLPGPSDTVLQQALLSLSPARRSVSPPLMASPARHAAIPSVTAATTVGELAGLLARSSLDGLDDPDVAATLLATLTHAVAAAVAGPDGAETADPTSATVTAGLLHEEVRARHAECLEEHAAGLPALRAYHDACLAALQPTPEQLAVLEEERVSVGDREGAERSHIEHDFAAAWGGALLLHRYLRAMATAALQEQAGWDALECVSRRDLRLLRCASADGARREVLGYAYTDGRTVGVVGEAPPSPVSDAPPSAPPSDALPTAAVVAIAAAADEASLPIVEEEDREWGWLLALAASSAAHIDARVLEAAAASFMDVHDAALHAGFKDHLELLHDAVCGLDFAEEKALTVEGPERHDRRALEAEARQEAAFWAAGTALLWRSTRASEALLTLHATALRQDATAFLLGFSPAAWRDEDLRPWFDWVAPSARPSASPRLRFGGPAPDPVPPAALCGYRRAVVLEEERRRSQLLQLHLVHAARLPQSSRPWSAAQAVARMPEYHSAEREHRRAAEALLIAADEDLSRGAVELQQEEARGALLRTASSDLRGLMAHDPAAARRHVAERTESMLSARRGITAAEAQGWAAIAAAEEAEAEVLLRAVLPERRARRALMSEERGTVRVLQESVELLDEAEAVMAGVLAAAVQALLSDLAALTLAGAGAARDAAERAEQRELRRLSSLEAKERALIERVLSNPGSPLPGLRSPNRGGSAGGRRGQRLREAQLYDYGLPAVATPRLAAADTKPLANAEATQRLAVVDDERRHARRILLAMEKERRQRQRWSLTSA